MAIALCDCNSFYCSCESMFRPDLRGRPIIVLSNNDGCVVSRSPEAKALGIAMGVPLFQIQQLVNKHRVAVFSSNYSLYGDMSRRVMEVLGQFSDQVEIYSIDEAFLFLPDEEDATAFSQSVRQRVKQWTGIPVSVGVGKTKVLAKVANKLAKKIGSFIITPDHPVLETVEVGDVWGIGAASARKLIGHGILNAAQLRDADDDWILKNLTVVGLKLVRELRGESCLSLELIHEPKKGMCVSRSFGQSITSLEGMKEAISTHTARMGEKLRNQNSLACVLQVFFHTNPFVQEPQCHRSAICRLPVPSSATAEMIRVATECVERTFKEGYRYKKCGVIVPEIVDDSARQQNLFYRPDWVRDDRVSAAMDKINRQFGTRSIQFGAEGLRPKWAARFDRRSPRYTTLWDELLRVRS